MISMSTCCGCREAEASAFPAWIFCTKKTESLFLALKCSTPSTSSAFPGQDEAPGIPQNQQTSANLLQTRAAQQCQTPGISQRCLCLPCRSLAVAESLFIVLAEGFVSLLPSKFPGI